MRKSQHQHSLVKNSQTLHFDKLSPDFLLLTVNTPPAGWTVRFSDLPELLTASVPCAEPSMRTAL